MKIYLELFRELLNCRRFIILSLFIVSIISIVIVFLIPVQYSVSVTILPPSGAQGISLASKLLPMSFSSGKDNISLSIDIYADMLRGNTILDSIINKCNLYNKWNTKSIVKTRWKLKGKTQINISGSQILTLTYTDENPDTAKLIVENYAYYLNKTINSLMKKSNEDELKNLLLLKNEILYKKDSLESQMIKWQEKNKSISLEKIEFFKAENNFVYNIYLTELEQYILLSLNSEPNSITLLKQKEKVDSLKNLLMNIPGNIIKNPDYITEYSYLTFALQANYMMLEEINGKILSIQSKLKNDINKILVIDAPVVPDIKSYPPRKIIVIVVFLLVFFIDLFIVFFRYMYKTSLSKEERNEIKVLFINAIKNPFKN